MQAKTISVLIPAYNEEERIGKTIRAVFDLPGIKQVLVADDGSRDNTAKEALQWGAEVFSLRENRGKGNALNAVSHQVSGDILLLLDADLGDSATHAVGLLLPVLRDQADMAVASFPKTSKRSGFGLVMGLAKRGIKHFTGFDFEAPLSGQRAMRREVFVDMIPLANGFGVEVDLTIRALLKGYRIVEVPLTLSHRVTGRNARGFYHRGKQFCHVISVLLSLKRLRYRNA